MDELGFLLKSAGAALIRKLLQLPPIALQAYRNFASTPTAFEGFDIHAALPILVQIFWGQFIAVQLEQRWQDCLWHGYRIEERGGESIILAPDDAMAKSVAAADDRTGNDMMACI